MKVAIIYASNSGSTFQVAEIIGSNLSNKYMVDIVKADDFDVRRVGEYSLIILGSPSWKVNKNEGSPHEAILQLFDRLLLRHLKHRKFALFGCGDTAYTNFCGAVLEMEKFVLAVKGDLVVPSLKIDGFYFDLINNRKLVERWASNLLKVYR